MFDNIAIPVYFLIGYIIIITYVALETAWHFTASKIPDKPIKLLYEFEPTDMMVLIK
jgi:hypothetical protein